jgi:peptidyl-prolyl cis-trans isomerase C
MTKRILCGVSLLLAAVVAGAQTTVMRVNGVEVAKNELEAARRVLGSQPGAKNVDAQTLERGAVEQVVGRILLAQAAREAKVTLEPDTVAKALDAQRKQAGGEEQFVKGLAEVGLTEKDVERVMGETLLVHRYVQTELAPKVTVTEADARKYYDDHPTEFNRPEEVKLQMLLVEVKAGADEAAQAAAKAKAEKALERITHGEDFAKVAAEMSDDPTKQQGGEVGWVPRGSLLHEIEDQVFTLRNGGVSSVLKSSYGYNVFRVEDRRPPHTLSFEEVKAKLTQSLKGAQLQGLVRQQVAALKAKAKIEYLDPALKTTMEAAAAEPAGPGPAGVPAKLTGAPAKPTGAPGAVPAK